MTVISTIISRLKIIASSGASRIIISLNSVICSFVIVRWQSSALWGELVIFLLFLDFGFSIIAWGVSPYLIREFSFHPKDIPSAWSKSFNSRIPLLIIFLVFILFSSFGQLYKTILCVWAIARYVYHSFEPIIQYQRNFIFSLFVEVISLVIILFPLITLSEYITIETLLYLFTGTMIWKAVASSVYFCHLISFEWPKKEFYILAFPFLLLTFSAMLQQRSDLYGVAYYLTKQDTAKYQVFINLLIFSQFLSSLLLSPFVKNIFRLSSKSFLKLEKRFMWIGIPLSALSIIGVYIIQHWVYNFEFAWPMYLLGYFYILPFYLYLLRNYLLGKVNQQSRVAIYCLVASGLNIGLSLLLIPLFQLEGALIAGVSAQIFLVILYHIPLPAHATR